MDGDDFLFVLWEEEERGETKRFDSHNKISQAVTWLNQSMRREKRLDNYSK